MDNNTSPIGYTENDDGYSPIFNPGAGFIVTQAFILCRYCGGAISPVMGPKYNAVCLSCYDLDSFEREEKLKEFEKRMRKLD